MGINPPAHLRLNDSQADAGKVKGGNGQDQHQTFQCLGDGKFTSLQLKPA
jgi:hypothetical protein